MNLQELKEKALKLKNNATHKMIEIKDKALEMKKNAANLKDEATVKTEKIKNKASELNGKANDFKDKAMAKTEELKDQASELNGKANVLKNKVKAKTEELKDQTSELKDQTNQKKEETIKSGKEKYFGIKASVNTKQELDFIIKKSATSSFVNSETGEEKFYKHKSIVLFAEEGTDFFKKAYYIIPILTTKAYSQNISVKFSKSVIEGVDLSEYSVDIKNLPCLVVFQEEKFYKKIEGEENILKLVKSLNLDINKDIGEA